MATKRNKNKVLASRIRNERHGELSDAINAAFAELVQQTIRKSSKSGKDTTRLTKLLRKIKQPRK